MVKVGLIGAGFMGRIHAENLKEDDRVRIVGIYDVKAEKAHSVAAMVQAKVVTNLEELYKMSDAVYVCTPNTQHVAPVLEALDRGIHVFSEKPMATSLSGAEKILEASEKSKAIYQIGFNERFAPVYKFAKEKIQKGFVPYSALFKMNRGELRNPPWVSDVNTTGGFLFESTIHVLDMARWLLGDVDEIYCRAKASVYQQLDDFAMILTFKGGAHATFMSCAHATWLFPFERIELYGDHATIVTEELDIVRFTAGTEREALLGRESYVEDYRLLPFTEKRGYRQEDRLFIDAIAKGTPPVVMAEDGYRAIELIEACYRSARSREAVKLPLE